MLFMLAVHISCSEMLFTLAVKKPGRQMAKIVSQRFVDVSAPYAHFLRVQGSADATRLASRDLDDAGEDFIAGSTVASPQERVARLISESSTASKATVTLRDETGRAEVTDGELGPGVKLDKTGSF